MENDAFEKYRSELPDNSNEQIQKLLGDLYNRNNVPEDMRVHIFCGDVSTGRTGNKRIRNIFTVTGFPIVNAPYDTTARFSVLI